MGLLLWFLLLICIVPLLEKDNAKRGVMVQAMFRSNFVLFGLPVAISLCGEDRIGTTSLLLGIIIPIYNVLAVITLELFRGGRPSVKKILIGIMTNPLIIASVLGVGAYIWKIDLPYAIEKTVVDIGKVATPLSLMALGGEFRFCKIPELDCVSIGPDMKDIHTTEEMMSISSVKRTWEFILKILEEA